MPWHFLIAKYLPNEFSSSDPPRHTTRVPGSLFWHTAPLMQIDIDRLILIVTGAHLHAENTDRPIAYRLRQRLLEWLDSRGDFLEGDAPRVLVCSDVWYLNNDPLRSRPTISIGGPGINALTAFLADKLPSAFAIEDRLVVQADLDFPDVLACCWGTDVTATAAAVEAFCDRYLDAFMEAAESQSQPEGI
jgi:hypothetical protein